MVCPSYQTYLCKISRVVSRIGIFGRYSVGISWYLPYRYRRKTRSVHFGIKKGAVPPFFLKRGAMAPFLRAPTPFWKKKGGGKGGIIRKRGERYRPKYRKSSKSDTSKIPIPKKLLVTPWYTTLLSTCNPVSLHPISYSLSESLLESSRERFLRCFLTAFLSPFFTRDSMASDR